MITDIDTKIKGNCRNIRDVANKCNVFIDTVHNIVTNILKYRKVCFQWVHRMLFEYYKKPRMNMLLYRDDGDDFLQHMVAKDETWCHHLQSERKSVCMQWKHPDSPRPKKFKVQPSTGKLC
ncbi:putative transposase [Trichonephila clavipes]|nr:putative transposase [Trichonephila clavipes]